ncbi:MAG: hypothetical protein WAU07_03120 [Microgenomates group bacterium]
MARKKTSKTSTKKISSKTSNDIRKHVVTILIAAVVVGITGFMAYAGGFLSLDLFGLKQNVAAFAVDPLPAGNSVKNPWFRSVAKPTRPGLDSWTDPAAPTGYWSTSQKSTNPSPDGINGTSARFADGKGQGGGGTGIGGVDAYLYQVVEANPSNTTLWFFTYWVTGWIDEASITIYGGETAQGPWNQVWVPLYVTAATTSDHSWTKTELLSQQIPVGYPYYKIEAFGRYPADRNQGFKFTGTYLMANNGETPVAAEPTPSASPGASVQPSRSPSPVASPTATPVSSPSPQPTVVPSPSIVPNPQNSVPQFETTSLSSTTSGRNYRARVRAYDQNLGDVLTMSVVSAPQGIVISGCTFGPLQGTEYLTCQLGGVSPAPGTYVIELAVQDQSGAQSTRQYDLVVN